MPEQLPERLGRVIDRYGATLLLYARSWCESPEDAVQQTFLKLFETRVWPDPLEPWLFRVARNAAISQSRSVWRRRRREQAAARDERWFEPGAEQTDAPLVQAALGHLSGELREIVIARVWGGLTFEQIATVHDTSLSTVYRRYQAALAELRKILGEPCPNNTDTTNR